MLCTFMYVPLSSIAMLYVILDVPLSAGCTVNLRTCMYVHCTLSSIATSTCCLIFGYTLCTTVSDMLLVLPLGNQLTFTRKPHVIKHVFAKTELFNSSMIDIYMHIHACEDSSTMAVKTMNIRPSKSAVMVTDVHVWRESSTRR